MLAFKAKGTTQILRATVTDQSTGNAVTTGTVTFRLQRAGADVPGVTWPVSASHVGNGIYEAIVSEALDCAAGDMLTLITTMDDGQNRKRVSRVSGPVEEA